MNYINSGRISENLSTYLLNSSLNNTAVKNKRSKPCSCRAVIDGGSVVAVATGVTTGIVLAPDTNSFS